MRRFSGVAESGLRWLLLAAACAPVGSCKRQDSFARAVQLTSLDQAVGGPVAGARVGDYLLENDQVRLVIEQGGSSKLPLDLGGSLIDADLRRPEALFRGGRGLDQLGQIAPVVNLFIAGAKNEKASRITRSEKGAEVTVSAEAVPMQKVLSAIGLLLKREFIAKDYDHSKFRMYTEYELRPGERLVRVRTTVGFDVPFCRPSPADGCNEACDDAFYDDDCSCPRPPSRCQAQAPSRVIDAEALPDRPEPMGLSDVLLGDLPRPIGTRFCTTTAQCAPGELCADITGGLGGVSRVCRAPSSRGAGLFAGDMLLFGGHLSVFIPGTGYDTESDIRGLFEAGQDTLSQPLKLDAVYAIGDRVSYGYAAASGEVLVPIFGGPFSMGVTSAASCRQDEPGCLSGVLVRSERWVSVGEGDAASAREPIAKARGVELREVKGTVLWAHSGRPVSGAEVYALADPRALGCEGDCRSRCQELSQLGDQELSSWSVEQLFEANRCRTVGGAHLDGVAGIDTVARTDVGTDPIRDGRFRMALPEGRYVFLAQDGDRATSALTPLKVSGSSELTFWLIEPGALEYRLVDERGEPSPGRAIIGRCLPGAACQKDSDCSADRCQAGACACERSRLRALELGGARMADGVLFHHQTANGQGRVELPPGDYEVVFSRGPHRSIDRRRFTIRAHVATSVQGQLVRAVDRAGWSSADFHVHAEPSLDSGTGLSDRVTSFLAEDVDFLSSSDHDVLTRYQPLIERMGARDKLGSHVGVEVTTQEIGHFVGFPLRYREWTEGADPKRLFGNDAPEWREKTPGQIFDSLRELAEPGEPRVVQVAHPYTYFGFYGLDPKRLEPSELILALFNPLLKAENFSSDFDSMELINSKGMDLIRRPTVGEVRFYGRELDRLSAMLSRGEMDAPEYQRLAYEASTEVTRRILHRTTAEQRAALAGEGAELSCRCGSGGDCTAGRVCDPATLSCVLPAELSGRPPAREELLCKSLGGVVDDWFGMLNRGMRRTGASGSDVHGLFGYEAGSPRTMLRTGGAKAPSLASAHITNAIKEGRAVVTNGPMLHFRVGGAEVGETVSVEAGRPVSLSLRVETAGWYDVDRVEVYRNGELLHWMSGCESARESDAEPHGHPCVRRGVVAFEDSFEESPPVDAWYVVIATGLDGRSLAPVYASAVMARLGTFEVSQRVFDIIPALSGIRVPRFPSLYPTFPVAVTNPIWVDIGGDGWKPPLPAPSWCTPGRDVGCKQ